MSKNQSPIRVVVDKYEITGWESLSLHMGMAAMPWQASLQFTTHQPGQKNPVALQEGDACSLYWGKEKLLTGSIVTLTETIAASGHSIALDIASKTLDLTDCSGSMVNSDFTIGGNQSSASTLGALAQRACQSFGVNVHIDAHINVPSIPLFAINLTEPPFAILDRLCRQCGVMFYDTPDGDIIITDVHDKEEPATLTYGKDIEEISIRRSTEGRYSIIKAVLQTSNLLNDPPDDQNYVSQLRASEAGKEATDPDIPRFRPLLIPVDLGDANFDVAGKRVLWEVARRKGRATPIVVRVPTWTDHKGILWRPNRPVHVTLPDGITHLRMIDEVTLSRSPSGTSAQLVLLTADSLKPEPIVNKLNQNAATQALNQNNQG